MRFHHVVSIIFGFIVFAILSLIAFFVFGLKTEIGNFLSFLSIFIAGFVATFFAKDRKIRYGIYEGI